MLVPGVSRVQSDLQEVGRARTLVDEERNARVFFLIRETRTHRYASLFFIVGVDNETEVRPLNESSPPSSRARPLSASVPPARTRRRIDEVAPHSPASQNELGVLEFIHALVETLDKYFESVCELDVSDVP